MSPRAAFRCAEGWFQGSLLSTGRDERLLVRGQADACPSRRSASPDHGTGGRVSPRAENLNLKRAVEPSTLFGFRFQGFKVSGFHPNRDRDRYRDRLFNHGTHRTHGKAWLCFRVFSVFRGSNQKWRSAPNRCGADLNGSQCLRGFAQNLHAQLLFLGLTQNAERRGVARASCPCFHGRDAHATAFCA